MNEEKIGPIVGMEEQVARFIMDDRWIRNSDRTIRQEAFIPHPRDLDLSVTRHLGFSDRQIWEAGETVAARRAKTLLGRADISAASVKQQSLEIKLDPVSDNPNHACIVGWPAEKSAQKSLAQQLAAAATLRKK